ncbi:MAG: hypothetical protein CVT62_06270 [Actinobacteria bacterium HGW-Actinobacteria-2]|nr:MAG: hypothetical protein CVT62_06270 [Actinobacteria bacterium HGW-Actinobacteria-2]
MSTTVVTALAPKLSAYSLLIRMVIDQRISAREFETLYLQLYQDDPTDWPIDVLDVLESLFADLDELFGPNEPGNPGRASSELQRRARGAYSRLAELAPTI